MPGPRAVDISASGGTGRAVALLVITWFLACRASSRCSCQRPSSTQAAATARASASSPSQRRVSRNRYTVPTVTAGRRYGDVGWAGAGGHLWPRRDRPAGLADRQVQPALLLLHAARGPGVAARPGAAHRRRAGAAGLGGRRPGRDRGAVHRRRAAAAPGPGVDRRAGRRAVAAAADAGDHQRHRAGQGGPGAGRRGPGPGERLAGHPGPRAVRHAGPSGPARRRPGRAGRCGRRRPHPGEGEHRPDARRERRRGGAAAAVGAGRGLPPAVHRADAAGRPARLGPRHDGDRRGDPGRPAGRVRPDPGGRGRARQRPGRGVGRRRRPRPGRRHRLGHPAVLRRLRPGPAHRRRAAAQLPVRPRGVRPARRRCAPAPPTRSSARRMRASLLAKLPGHGIDDPGFLQPTRPMSAIGG